ncbi:MAG TPA: lipoyl(octanoyl) transferase LipB [Longimicrobiales bacterium]|nr:lipoyl(octanoyl) transferase LipB [Longimicrobiales bacterium]
MDATLEVHDLGTVPYAEALAVQADLVRRRRAGEIGDRLLLLEHPHVITLGTGADEEHILATDAERRLMGIELHETGRGGDVTYHGPGQLVGYPILALPDARRDLHRYVRDLEAVLIAALSTYGIAARREEGLTGVWTDAGKVAAIGVRVSSGWITSHGFALNVAPRLDYFGAIVPCGIRGRPVTSMEAILGEAPDMGEVRRRVADAFAAEFAAGVRMDAP